MKASMGISKKLHIDAIQTAIPSKVIAPGKSRRINLTNTSLTQKSLQNRFQMVFYYQKNNEEESAWTVAAWVKESISVALSDWPELAGRLRKEGEGEGYWDMKFNDAGVRLIQASMEMSLDEFLAMEDREEKEATLVDWSEIDWENPNFSALFYVQVTRFEGEGYAIGIACSLLLADPLFLIRFLKSWSQTHMQMIFTGSLSKKPMFHLGYFQRLSQPKHLKSIFLDSISSLPIAPIVKLFKAPICISNEDIKSYKKLASTCFEEAIADIGKKDVSRFSLIVNGLDILEIESCEIDANEFAKSDVETMKWDELGMGDFTLAKGNKPILVSYRIISCLDEGLVVVMQSSDQAEDCSEMVIGTIIPNN
ncbi:hypothetical protein LUZ60_016845 [Juncus effusus]|nr:hypothetical protein LUZ60_016845 [Juncus effusus]